MTIDTSALIAILQNEPQRRALTDAILVAPLRRMSAATLVEAGIVMQGRFKDDGAHRLDMLLLDLSIEVVPLTSTHAAFAREAFRRYGKGQHPAGLNFGDCFSYALARALDEPLLFVGSDFSQTDITAVAY